MSYCKEESEAECREKGYNCDCADGKMYYGRGPIQLSYNFNYGLFSSIELGNDDLVKDPDILVERPYLGFKAAIWFWMTPQYEKPSCHDVITDFSGTTDDKDRGYDFGHCTDIINGGVECYQGVVYDAEKDRIRYYDRYLAIFGVQDDRNRICLHYPPYAFQTKHQTVSNMNFKTFRLNVSPHIPPIELEI